MKKGQESELNKPSHKTIIVRVWLTLGYKGRKFYMDFEEQIGIGEDAWEHEYKRLENLHAFILERANLKIVFGETMLCANSKMGSKSFLEIKIEEI